MPLKQNYKPWRRGMLWTREAIVLESYCSVTVDLITVGNANNSVYAFKVIG
jgi:hypothetical protein